MNINRRSVIKYFVLISAGTIFLPSCKNDNKKNSAAFKNIPIDEDQQATLAEIAETIIPATDTPGAKEVSAHIFALQMLNDCYDQNDRDKFIKGMKQFEDNVEKKYKKTFTECSVSEREAIVAAANSQMDKEDDDTFFFKTLKQLTVRAYTNSKYYLTNVEVYRLVPGKYISSKAV